MSIERGRVNMLDGPLTQNILRFTLPLALTGILQQLFNAADVVVVGRFVGSHAMAAVGSNSPIVGLVVNFFGGLSMGSNVVLSQLTGMKDWHGVRKTVDLSLLLALLCGCLGALAGQFLAAPILTMMNVPDEVFSMAVTYLRIYLAGLPVILLYNFEAAILRSQGDSFTPLIALSISGLTNAVLNVLFVTQFGMTADGVALATVISNALSALILFFVLLRTSKPVAIRWHKLELDPLLLKKVLAIGLPGGVQSAMFSVSNICIQSAINELGAIVMAASSAAFNIEIFMYYILNAFGQACTTFTGQNNGAGNHARCRAVFKRCFLLTMSSTVCISALLLVFGRPLLSLFNTEALVIQYGMTRLICILVPEVLSAAIELISGALRGYGCSTPPAVISIFGVCAVRILWVYTVFARFKTFGVLLACYGISWGITTLMLTVAYLIFLRRQSSTLAAV